MVLWIEGFEEFGVADGASMAGLEQKYNGIFDATRTRVRAGRLGGVCLSHEPVGAGIALITPNLGNMGTVITGFGFKTTFLPIFSGDVYRIVTLREENNATDGVNLRVGIGGVLHLYRGNTLLATSTETIITGRWYHIQVKVVVANSGSYEVRVGATTYLSGSADTQAGSTAAATNVAINSPPIGGGNIIQFDDWYVADDSGAENNDFLGDCKVGTIFPNGDVESDFTPSTGSDNYAMVDDNPSDADDTYVESSTPDHQDLYEFTNSEVTGDYIATQANVVCRKSDTDDFDVKLVLKSGSTEDVGAAQTVDSTDYGTKHRIDETNPDTDGPWDTVSLNALQAGYRVG